MGACSFAIAGTDGRARAGTLSTPHGPIHTPASLVYTRRGGCPSLTPDTLERLQPAPQGLQISAVQFLSNPTPESLNRFGKGGHDFLGLPRTLPVLASNRDPCMYEYGAKPSSDAGAYATIHSGGILVTPEKYMQAVQALQPDLYVTLCDEVTADVSAKRLGAACARTVKWMDLCLKLGDSPQLSDPAQSEGPHPPSRGSCCHSPAALAAIPGAACTESITRAAAAAAQRDAAFGFALCGFGTGEDGQQRVQSVSAALSQLPDAKPRFISGMAGPAEVLHMVQQGLDLFDTAYVTAATTGGYALCFPLSPEQPASCGPEDAQAGVDSHKLNLWAAAHRNSKQPPLPGCGCYTCRSHTRAYLHHLLQANEMLAEVLLDIHNTHHFEGFMAAVRAAIHAGKLSEYVAWADSRGRDEMPASVPVVAAAGNGLAPTLQGDAEPGDVAGDSPTGPAAGAAGVAPAGSPGRGTSYARKRHKPE